MIFHLNSNYVSYFENFETDLNQVECKFVKTNQIIIFKNKKHEN